MAVIVTTPWWPHGGCGTGVNDPTQYALCLLPFGVRCFLVRGAVRLRKGSAARGFEVLSKPPGDSPPVS
jgi:hypothetical protein